MSKYNKNPGIIGRRSSRIYELLCKMLIKILIHKGHFFRDQREEKKMIQDYAVGIPRTNEERRKDEGWVYFRYTLDIQSLYKR